jgi:hypothetical protein
MPLSDSSSSHQHITQSKPFFHQTSSAQSQTYHLLAFTMAAPLLASPYAGQQALLPADPYAGQQAPLPADSYAGQQAPLPTDPHAGQQTTLPIQTQRQAQAPSSHDPLLEALRKYVTSGPNASHVTSDQLQEAYTNAIEGSRDSLELFLARAQSIDENRIWEIRSPFKGHIDISPLEFTFSLGIDGPIGIPLAVHGKALNVFYPWSGEVKYV